MTGRSGVVSAGLLLWRRRADGLQVLLGHPGGPFFTRRDAGVWSIPKGELAAGEDPMAGARREFAEELGLGPPAGAVASLGEVRLRSGKTVVVWALEADLDLAGFQPGLFELEWPRGSGVLQSYPELDRVQWWPLDEARAAITVSQQPFLDRLAAGAQ